MTKLDNIKQATTYLQPSPPLPAPAESSGDGGSAFEHLDKAQQHLNNAPAALVRQYHILRTQLHERREKAAQAKAADEPSDGE